jgi:cytosine/adenosine deaminase-related metal-dependent hydrolase
MLCCEVTDRHGRPTRVAALRETEAFLASARSGRVRAAVGGHASFTLETETLQAMSQLATAYGAGVHLHAAESPDDESETRKRFEKGIVQRLLEAGLLGPRMILAHCIHFAWEDFSALHTSGAWLVHCARSDMRRNTGYAPAGKFGPRKALGTDGLGGDILAEGQACYLRGHEAGFPIDLTRWHSAGQQMATELFGQPMGALKPGAVADLVVLDYPVATELSAQTLPGHLGLGIGAAHVDAAMIDGIWRLWAREVLSFDEPELRSRARPAAQRLWSRMSEL